MIVKLVLVLLVLAGIANRERMLATLAPIGALGKVRIMIASVR